MRATKGQQNLITKFLRDINPKFLDLFNFATDVYIIAEAGNDNGVTFRGEFLFEIKSHGVHKFGGIYRFDGDGFNKVN